MRTIQSGSRTLTLVRAIAEPGRIAKTLFLLAYIDDEAYRRRILVQLNRGEWRRRAPRRAAIASCPTSLEALAALRVQLTRSPRQSTMQLGLVRLL
jgi:hypothetical protein